MALIVGIDCGGTSTRAVAVTGGGEFVGVGRGGVGNPNAAGREAVEKSIRDAVTAALSGSADTEVAAVFAGMAGVVGEKDSALGRSILAAAMPGVSPARTGLDHDIRISLAGGLAGAAEGIALIVGTGSSCYARRADGESCQSGGWGSVLDDGGSAHGLGLAAMKAAVRVADGRLQASAVLAGVMKALGLGEIREIVDRVYRKGMSKAEVAALAPVVIDAWKAGDAVAKGIVSAEVEELAWIVETAARRMSMASPRVVYTGGLVENVPEYAAEVVRGIVARVPTAKVSAPALPPVLGAVLLAAEMAGQKPEVLAEKLKAVAGRL